MIKRAANVFNRTSCTISQIIIWRMSLSYFRLWLCNSMNEIANKSRRQRAEKNTHTDKRFLYSVSLQQQTNMRNEIKMDLRQMPTTWRQQNNIYKNNWKKDKIHSTTKSKEEDGKSTKDIVKIWRHYNCNKCSFGISFSCCLSWTAANNVHTSSFRLISFTHLPKCLKCVHIFIEIRTWVCRIWNVICV